MKVWYPVPPDIAVIEILQKKGSMTDKDLLKQIKKQYEDICFRELNRTLMRLEIQGFLRVTRLMKDKRNVELIEIDRRREQK